MTQESYRHPITPPPELVQQWCDPRVTGSVHFSRDDLAARAAQWGADQELEVCCEWLDERFRRDPFFSKAFRDMRRPKPPNLKEQALETLQRLSKDGFPCNYQEDADWDTIRRALEQLPDNE